MKKNILTTILALAVTLTACNSGNNSYKVNVVRNLGYDNLIGGTKVMVVTESNDSVESFIAEGLLFNNKLPFPAQMKKSEVGRYGFITDSVSNDKFDVTVTKKAGYDNLLGGEKVIAITKSGMLVECFISEEILLKNKIPFPAKMAKGEAGRYGFIR